MRPLELVGFSGVLALFAGLVVLLVLRTPADVPGLPAGIPDFRYAGVVAGIVFIVTLMIVALIGLGGKPSDEDLEARKDLRTPDKDGWH